MTHYDTLGVDRTATPDAIKQAYRRESSKAHPDKGGSDEAMAAVNAAYDVLRDPDRRARYDQTGTDHQPDSIDTLAKATALEELSKALQREGDPIAAARRSLTDAMTAAGDALMRERRKVLRLQARRGHINVSDGDNLVHMLIDQQLAAARQLIQTIEAWHPVAEKALKLLDAHTYTGPAPEGERYGFFRSAAAGVDHQMLLDEFLGLHSRRGAPRYFGADMAAELDKKGSARKAPPDGAAGFKRDRWGQA